MLSYFSHTDEMRALYAKHPGAKTLVFWLRVAVLVVISALAYWLGSLIGTYMHPSDPPLKWGIYGVVIFLIEAWLFDRYWLRRRR